MFPNHVPIIKCLLSLCLLFQSKLDFGQNVYSGSLRNECINETKVNELLNEFDHSQFEAVRTKIDSLLDRPYQVDKKSFRCTISLLELKILSYLYEGNQEMARVTVHELLYLDPIYDFGKHPSIRFRQLVEQELSSDHYAEASYRFKTSVVNNSQTNIRLTAKDIKLRGYTNLIEILQDLPGIDLFIRTDYTYASVYMMGIKEEASNHILLTIDGAREVDPWGNLFYLSRQYPLSLIKQIEFVYGPSSEIYGPGAFSGAVHIITYNNYELTGYNRDLDRKVGGQIFTSIGNPFTQRDKLIFDGSLGFNFSPYFSLSATFKGELNDNNGTVIDRFLEEDPYFNDTELYRNRLEIHDSALLNSILPLLPKEHNYFNLEMSEFGDKQFNSLVLTDEGVQAAQEHDKAIYSTPPQDAFGILSRESNYYYAYRLKLQDFKIWFSKWESFNYAPNSLASRIHIPRWDTYRSGGVNYGLRYDDIINSFSRINVFLNYKNYTNFWQGVGFCGYRFNDESCPSSNSYDITDLIDDKSSEWAPNRSEFPGSARISKDLKGELNYIRHHNQNLTIRGGLEANNIELIRSYLISGAEDNPISSWDVGLYGGVDYKLPFNLQIRALLRSHGNLFYTTRYEGGFSDRRRVGTQIIPEFSWNLNLSYIPLKSLEKSLAFQWQYSRGFNNPSKLAMFPDTSQVSTFSSINAFLRAERNDYFEARLRYLTPDMSILLSGNFMKARSIVSPIPHHEELDIVVLDNNQSYQNFGIIAFASYRGKFRNPESSFKLYINYSYLDSKKRLSSKESFIRVGGIAKHRINAGFQLNATEKLFLNANMSFMSGRQVGEGTTLGTNTGEFSSVYLVNTTLSYTLQGFVMIQLIGRNILNRNYFQPGPREGDNILYISKNPQFAGSWALRLIFNFYNL